MEKITAQGIISDWVAQQDEPFTSRDVFDGNDDLENIGTVYAAMNALFNTGEIARKKVDGTKFIYISASKAPDDFEVHGSPINSAVESNQIGADIAIKSQADIGPENEEKIQQKHHVSKTQKPGKSVLPPPAPQPVNTVINADIKTDPQPKSETRTENTSIQLPAAFTLKLEAPGGLIITITSEQSRA